MQASSDFEYLREAATKYGKFWLADEFQAFLQSATETEVRDLREIYESIRSRGDAERLSRWIDRCGRPRVDVSYDEREFCRRVGRLLVLFDFLGENLLVPFSSGDVQYVEPVRTPDWSNLPSELEYLREPADSFGRYSSEGEVGDFLARATPEDLELLARTAEQVRVNRHHELITQWFERNPFDTHYEAWLVYWLFGVMDHAGLRWEN
jgi:hypothetical protein